jgi:uncharacterized protein (UPF0548 family)
MFLLRRPSPAAIDRFLRQSQDAPLSYSPVGLVKDTPGHRRFRRFDEQVVAIGHGMDDFRRARAALRAWKQFDIGWTHLYPRQASVEIGTVVAVIIRHLGIWSINGGRVLYHAAESDADSRFGYAYGTLTNHAEHGEELFEVFVDPQTGNVMYRIRAVSWPQAALALLGAPIVWMLQARFRRHSAAAMARATRAGHR